MIEFIILTTVVWLLIWCMEVHNKQAGNPLTILTDLVSEHGNMERRVKETHWKYEVSKPWKLPYFLSASRPNSSKDLKRANKYLKHMQRKLVWALNNPNKTDYGDKVVDTLLSRSKSFLLLGLINSDNKYYFNKPFLELMEIISDARMKLRTKSIDMLVKRHYLVKEVTLKHPDGNVEYMKYNEYLGKYPEPEKLCEEWVIDKLEQGFTIQGIADKATESCIKVNPTKWRPIGAPDESTKLIFALMVLIINEYNFIHLPDYQHGFRPNKGVATACMRLRELLIQRKYEYIYEFDLKGFFNSVNYYFTIMKFAAKSGLLSLAVWIELINTYLIPKLPKAGLKKETELYWEKENKILCKSGFTQGSPLSPPMSMIGLEESGLPALLGDGGDELIMYADDGILLSSRDIAKEDFEFMFNYISRINSGVLIAKDKYFGRVNNEFKYLGLLWNLEGLTVTSKDGTFDLTDGNLHWGKIFSQADYYQRRPKVVPESWHWKIVDESLVDRMWDKWHTFNKSRLSLIRFGQPLINKMAKLIDFSGYLMTIWDPKWSKAWRFYATYNKGKVVKWGFVNTMSASSLAAETMLRVLDKMEDRTGIIELGNDNYRSITWYERHLVDRRRILRRAGFEYDYGLKGVMRYYTGDTQEAQKQKEDPTPWEYQWLHPWAYSYDQTGPQETGEGSQDESAE